MWTFLVHDFKIGMILMEQEQENETTTFDRLHIKISNKSIMILYHLDYLSIVFLASMMMISWRSSRFHVFDEDGVSRSIF